MSVVIYTTRFCPYCIRAKNLLQSKGVQFQEIPVDGNYPLRQEMMRKSGQSTVPQIWIGDLHVGGCDDLYDLERAGELDAMLVDAGQRAV
ncbi:glutaredoxin 3 [Halioxenophilus sp. WMMB6]|uniref:glutaredoxin 3 n=1 Tax=Halioxenophilus sp. WMMB6 TaxID=3073815 RepID=UPI00295E2849|nr:glutaredoxin 3 [Halioxenophilus sp. WMMB6]